MSRKIVSKEPESKAFLAIATFMLSLTLFAITLFLGTLLISNDTKKVILNSSMWFVDHITKGISQIREINCRFALTTIYFAVIIVGIATTVKSIFIWFLTSKTIEIPLLRRNYPFIPPFKNKFYRDDLVKTPEQVKNLNARLKEAKRENKRITQEYEIAKQIITQLKQSNKELSEFTQDYFDYKKLADHNVYATEELYKLLGHVLALVCCVDQESYLREYTSVMNEFANTLTKLTIDQVNDKYSSIMAIVGDSMVIVGSHGLNHDSKKKTFTRGQGLAGWIWENGQPAICRDVNEDERFRQTGCHPSGLYRSIIGVPVFDCDKAVIGALFVQSRRPNVFVEEDLAMLSYCAVLLAIIFTNHMLRGKIISDAQSNPVPEAG